MLVWLVLWRDGTAERDQILAGQVFRFLLGGHPLHLEAEVARLPLPLCN
jgi:hypothetical protein